MQGGATGLSSRLLRDLREARDLGTCTPERRPSPKAAAPLHPRPAARSLQRHPRPECGNSANTARRARAAGCFGKGPGARGRQKTFPGSLARLARLAARTFLFALGSALEVRFLAALRFTSDARNGDGGASANAGTGNSSYGSIPDSSVGEDG